MIYFRKYEKVHLHTNLQNQITGKLLVLINKSQTAWQPWIMVITNKNNYSNIFLKPLFVIKIYEIDLPRSIIHEFTVSVVGRMHNGIKSSSKNCFEKCFFMLKWQSLILGTFYLLFQSYFKTNLRLTSYTANEYVFLSLRSNPNANNKNMIDWLLDIWLLNK